MSDRLCVLNNNCTCKVIREQAREIHDANGQHTWKIIKFYWISIVYLTQAAPQLYFCIHLTRSHVQIFFSIPQQLCVCTLNVVLCTDPTLYLNMSPESAYIYLVAGCQPLRKWWVIPINVQWERSTKCRE